jgi:C1A family cysteine protease
MVSNSHKLCHTANFSAGHERPQGGSCWAYAAAHAIQSLVKTAERDDMVTNSLVGPVDLLADEHVK